VLTSCQAQPYAKRRSRSAWALEDFEVVLGTEPVTQFI
jgi:hypothetical protein